MSIKLFSQLAKLTKTPQNYATEIYLQKKLFSSLPHSKQLTPVLEPRQLYSLLLGDSVCASFSVLLLWLRDPEEARRAGRPGLPRHLLLQVIDPSIFDSLPFDT